MKLKVSFTLNIIIFSLVVLATTFMLTGFQFMGHEEALVATRIEAFKFFTVDSNVLMGLTALLFAIFEYKIIKKEKKEIPNYLYILKLIFTGSVMLTFLVTTFYLAPNAKNGFFSLFKNCNLFFHFIVPVLSFIVFVFFENTKKIEFKSTKWIIAPTGFYAIFYIIYVVTHIENGSVSRTYDMYGFAQGSIGQTIFIVILLHIITYIIGLVIWFLNRKLCLIKK